MLEMIEKRSQVLEKWTFIADLFEVAFLLKRCSDIKCFVKQL